MAFTDINSEDRLVQETFANHLADALGWDTVYAWNNETFGPDGTLGRASPQDVVLTRDLRAALVTLNPDLPAAAIDDALKQLTHQDFTRSTVQHNQDFYRMVRDGVPVTYRDANGNKRQSHARCIEFRDASRNRFLAVRELKITGLKSPHYNRRADVVCFVNGLPLVFIELKAVYNNIRAGFDGNIHDYKDTIPQAFHHNAFLIVSNGHRAKYGSITSGWDHFGEWKRNDESDKGKLDAQVMLDGMLAKDRLLDIVENFVLFDASRAGPVRKIVARNQQILGVNRAVASVARQEAIKREIPPDKRLVYRVAEMALADDGHGARLKLGDEPARKIQVIERAHPDLGQLGVFWHTQGSGKSYSMVLFTEKVLRTLPGNFTFVLMTDRVDLDGQLHATYVGCGAADQNAPRAASGADLRRLLGENHRYVFSVIHKFNQNVDPKQPYSERDDIIVLSDEAHRTQGGKLARNMRLALPNAAFIGFTGTPLFKNDELTKRIFGQYVSRYDFKRSEEDGATVKLIYDNRGEKLGIARMDLNDQIADAIDKAELDPDKEALLQKLLGKNYEVITAPERLDAIADDFVKQCVARWEAGKSMLVCIDKLTCARMLQRIQPRWAREADRVRASALSEADPDRRAKLERQVVWMNETIIEIIISEAQNEVADFAKEGFDIKPHRAVMKLGFETPDGKRVGVESAFKDDKHPFRVAIVCAMWLTGFDVECLSTLYIDKPMKAHTLMQAIARANRRFPGKDFGLIVDYNGMLSSLRAALAQYALGDDGDGSTEIVGTLEQRVFALDDAIRATEAHLLSLGFDVAAFVGATDWSKIGALAAAVEAVYKNDEAKRRFELLARQVFIRFKSLVTEPSAQLYAERHDNIEAIYKKLSENCSKADISDLLNELRRIVGVAIANAQSTGPKEPSKTYDLSQIDLDKLRREFANMPRRATAIRDIRDIVEQKLAQMVAQNPLRMDWFRRYGEIIADYNNEKDRVTIEDTFAQLVTLIEGLDAESKRHVAEGLSEEELAVFDLLQKEGLTRAERETVKQSSRELLSALERELAAMDQWTLKEETQSNVRVLIADHVYKELPTPPFSEAEKQELAERTFNHIRARALGAESWRKVA